MNPYADQLGHRNPFEVIASTAERLDALIAALGSDAVMRPRGPGKWSPREIACHLADCEIVFAFRLRQALAEDHHVIQPFDQDRWARSYGGFDAHAALEVFSVVRRWNLALIRAASAEVLARPLTHPERGELTFQELVETMAGHDLNHLRQLETPTASV